MHASKLPNIIILFLLLFTAVSTAACSQPAKTEVTVTGPAATTQPAETPVPVLKVGDAAPPFTLGDIDNKPVSLSDFAGKKVIINMWILNCHGCEEELPYLQEFWDKWKGQGVALIGINNTNSIALVRSYASSKKLQFPLLVDTGRRLNPSYAITGVPTTFFIDEKGIIRAIKDGSFESAAEIEEILKSYQGQ